MAGAMRRSLVSLTSKVLKTSTRWAVGNGVKMPKPAVTLTRSLWCVAANNSNKTVMKAFPTSRTCSCCKMHTEVDEELVKHLEEEIANEKSADVQRTPKIDGWDIKTNVSEVILQRKNGDETIEVKLNVNNSVRADEQSPSEGQEDSVTPMVSKPPFEVNIKKKTGKILAFQCDFYEEPEYEDENVNKEQDVGDLFNINEVTLHTGEVNEADYFLTADVMDATLYDLFMDMLDDRGVNNDFMTSLVDFATSYEHDQYVNFLETLKTAVQDK